MVVVNTSFNQNNKGNKLVEDLRAFFQEKEQEFIDKGVMSTSGKRRAYKISDEKLSSVTTILNEINKPALQQWAVNVSIDGLYERLKEDYEVVDMAEEKIRDLFDKFKKEFYKVKQKAADVGTIVHSFIEGLIKDELSKKEILKQIDEIENEEKKSKVKKSFGAFLKWAKENRFLPILSEMIVFDEDKKYAGTLDLLSFVFQDNDLYLMDLKTSNGFYDSFGLQLVAYKNALLKMFPEIVCKFNLNIRTGILLLSKETGEPQFYDTTCKEIYFQKMFDGILEFHNAKKQYSKVKI